MLFVSIVLDGVGIGEQPDAGLYGDEGSHTLAHVCSTAHPDLPHLGSLGLGLIDSLEGVEPVTDPLAGFGKMREVSAGKDSTSGHWELAGLRLEHPFPTYPDGFPDDVIDRFCTETGCRGVLGNKPASGTQIIAELGKAHCDTGFPIVYTSADSVFQVAAHDEVIPVPELYRICRIARDRICTGVHAVGRVIARPFTGRPGAFERLSAARKDFSLAPPATTLQAALQAAGVRTIAVGKIGDLFAGVGFDEVHKTYSNAEGIERTIEFIQKYARSSEPAFVWTNLVDFDQEFGHRNDPYGFAGALETFDRSVPLLLESLGEGNILAVTADHGNDPITPSTDHSREYVPLLVYDGSRGRSLGIRESFSDHAASIAAYFGVPYQTDGKSFL